VQEKDGRSFVRFGAVGSVGPRLLAQVVFLVALHPKRADDDRHEHGDGYDALPRGKGGEDRQCHALQRNGDHEYLVSAGHVICPASGS